MRTYLVLILLVAAVAVGAASLYGFSWNAKQARSDAIERMSFRAERAALSIASAMTLGGEQVEAVAGQPGLAAVFANPEACTLTVAGAGPFQDIRLDIVDRDGTVFCTSGTAASVKTPGLHGDSQWLRDVVDGDEAPARPRTEVDRASGRPAVVMARPVRDGETVVGAVVLFMDVPAVAEALAEDLSASDRASFTLVESGTSAVLSTSERAPQGAPSRFAAPAAEGQWAGVDGTERFFGSSQVPAAGWRVFAGAEKASVLADARGSLLRQALVGGLALLLLAVAVGILSRRIARPLRTVTDAVARAGREPGAARLREVGPAEVVTLAREFNAMLDVRAGHEAQLAHQATHDSLTALPNRVLLRDRLDHALLRDRHGASIAVLFVGLNRFRIVNDSLGHDAGDRVLVQVAERLATALRPGDTLARFGGDQFVVLCEEVGSADAVAVAGRLQECLARPFLSEGAEIVLQATIGIAVGAGADVSAERLLREADSAMTQAKSTGKGWLLFDEALRARATRHLEVELELQRALQRQELRVHYQPVLEVATGRIVGAEALARWEHPERGLVPPLDFIPIAEETGQIAAIGRFVLQEACRQRAAWAAAGHPLRMSVNVAVDQLRRGDFAETVRQVLVETGVSADDLCLEITESSLIREAEQGLADLERLRALGVHLSIDDFGTGYSSLSYLHRLPVDELKIDRSFTNQLGRGVRETHLVEAITGMARALGLAVVAEGVESGEQLELLAGLGCQLAQGYLIAPPQQADEVLTTMTRMKLKKEAVVG